ncbi:MAG: hypothetical protein RJB01_599 [Actinomycetota bacterium]|jgi:hypothetical protein
MSIKFPAVWSYVMRSSRSLAILGLALLIAIGGVTPAQAATSSKNANGQTLTVNKARNLNPSGQTITVRGKNFDPRVGIYVALCVIPPKGQQPTPCGGGVDMDGSSSASAWVSSNPPPYGEAIAIPYGKNGSFTARIRMSSMIGDIDCRTTRCAVVSRADHLRSNDRSFDVFVPVSFR